MMEIRNLTKSYDEGEVSTLVLRGLDFKIEKGEFVAVMGPSGSGKSTLLHILGLLERQSGGEYFFGGKQTGEYSEDEIAKVRNKKLGFIFQSFNLLPRTTVLENVKLPLLYSAVMEELWDGLARQAIEAVGLSHRVDFEPSQLSGGEKQRVAIARALVNNPEVIFADEPTGNLDSKSGEVVMEIIQKLHNEMGHTVILITHETYTAEYAERIIRLRDGMIESDTNVLNRRAGKLFQK
ncbi:MAG TPA: ABC transporter ATP-binding protein [Candidatus Paceibacterota bacterium]|nr:ABC transporter ATP-binding protein [Candidatus Paceibacterota bacterium]